MNNRIGNDISRFWKYVSKAPTGCWDWIGGKGRGGYGKFMCQKKTLLAHRFSYATFKGEIGSGLQLDHLCRNRACVNPEHLEPVTGRTNLLRGETWAAKNVAKTHCPHGHEYTAENTYIYPDGRRRCITCRRKDDLKPEYAERRKLHKRAVRLAERRIPDPEGGL